MMHSLAPRRPLLASGWVVNCVFGCCFGCLFGALVLGPAVDVAADNATDDTAVRLEMPLFGDVVQVEVRDTERAPALEAIRQALLRMHDFAAYVAPDSPQQGSLGEIQRRAGNFVPVTDEIFDFVVHGLRYCLWSGGVHGPLGGDIYRLWERSQGGVSPLDLRDAVAAADCSRLGLEGDQKQVRVDAGVRLTGFGMERGYAMEFAVTELRRRGVDNAILEMRGLIRAFGPGSGGRGWLVQLPGVEGSRQPLDQLYLDDQSLAWVAPRQEGESRRLPINQRTGVPTLGVRLVAVVTSSAADSEALVHTLYAMGHSLGQRHVGSLDPRPSVLWLLGTGAGLPLESPYRWSELDRVREPR